MAVFEKVRWPGGAFLATFACALVAATPVASGAARGGEPSAEVRAVLDRLDRAQRGLRSLRAEVSETRTPPGSGAAETLEGHFAWERPGRLRWDFERPERRVYVLAAGTLSGFIPSKSLVETLDISKYEPRVRRLMVIGQDAASLLHDFRIEAGPGPATEGLDELVLSPRSRRARHRLQAIRLWIDRAGGLPRRVRYDMPDGSAILLDFRDVRVDPDIAPDTFVLKPPPGARVVRGFSSLGFGAGGDADAADPASGD
jgi:outer membrane lipoprotein carrier protein